MNNPFTAALNMQRQAWEGAADVAEKTQVAPDRTETLENIEVGQTPSEVVYEENKLELLHYEPQTEDQHNTPILIVYALINKPYILDLQPDRSVVQTLLQAGFDVYLIDWGEPSKLDRSLTLDDYVNRYIDNCVDEVCERAGMDAINVLGYCMGGTMSVMYSALHPEKVENLALMASGLCFTGEGGVLELWGAEEYYDPERVTETFDNVPAEFLDIGFALMDPVANNVTKYVRFYDNMDDEDFVENFARMERWLDEGIDVAGNAYEEFIEDVYQDNQLIENELYLDGNHVDIDNLEMPVLQIVAEYDHLIPPEASKPFNEAIPSDDTEVMEFATGHIGMSVSSRSHAELWPDVCEWLEERSNGESEASNASEDASGDRPRATESAAESETPEPKEPDAALTEDVAGDETGTGDLTDGGATVDRVSEDDLPGDDRSDEEIAERAEEDVEEEPPEPGEMTVDEEIAEEITDEAVVEESGDDLTDLSGIGQAYAESLTDAGIETFDDLAAADVADLATETGISPNRIESWIEQASEQS